MPNVTRTKSGTARRKTARSQGPASAPQTTSGRCPSYQPPKSYSSVLAAAIERFNPKDELECLYVERIAIDLWNSTQLDNSSSRFDVILDEFIDGTGTATQQQITEALRESSKREQLISGYLQRITDTTRSLAMHRESNQLLTELGLDPALFAPPARRLVLRRTT